MYSMSNGHFLAIYQAANKEVDERKKEINMKDHITPNETYQEFLEVLHKYRKRSKSGGDNFNFSL